MQLLDIASRTVASTMIMIPMYIPLLGAPQSWDPIFASIGCNPTVQFQLIINPVSGPGPNATTPPTQDYINRIAKLHSYPNTKLLAYVHTSWGARAIADVEADISKYAGWSDPGGQNIHMDGIFFDEAPAKYTTIAGGTGPYMTNASSFARSNGFNFITFNPGTLPDTRFFALADNIIVFENAFSQWTSSVQRQLKSALSTSQLAKSVVMIYSYTGKAVDQYTITQAVTGMKMSAVFVTSQNGYTVPSTLWGIFVSLLGVSDSGL